MSFRYKELNKVKTISIFIDIGLILFFLFKRELYVSNIYLLSIYLVIVWFLTTFYSKFYNVNSYSKPNLILSLSVKQCFIFFIFLYVYIGFFKEFGLSRLELFRYLLLLFLYIFLLKLLTYFFLIKNQRIISSGKKKIIIIGVNNFTNQLKGIFETRKDYGYELLMMFNLDKGNNAILDNIKQYIIENNVDELYCSVSSLSNEQITALVLFAEKNFKKIKFIPDNKHLFLKRLNFEYYDYLPVLSIRETPDENPIKRYSKRIFDIVLSLFTIIFILSWLIPIVGFLIKIESKGSIFFKQQRTGLNNDIFWCYKFRSMRPNKVSDTQQATKGDMRITKVGRFIRKTSIDELPQFINVLLGNMSIVGPRPHMVSQTELYVDTIDKFMIRHSVKPGITGLAQVKGCRGEIERDRDMLNRVKFDVFYIENWSIFLDMKIIFQTIYNAVKGEEKAY